MSEWYESQNKQSSNIRKLLQERIEKANPHHEWTAEETKRLNKLEGIADKLKRGKNVQNRQLQTRLSYEEYEQLEYVWQEQLGLSSGIKDKLSKKTKRIHNLLSWKSILAFRIVITRKNKVKKQKTDPRISLFL